MKKILMLNPSISSYNMGDHIIAEGAQKQLQNLIKDSFVVDVSTHLPISRYLKATKNFDHKFVCGSNLIRGKMNRRFRQWDIMWHTTKFIQPVVLLGVGWWQYGDEPNFYTKSLYKRVLSEDYIHSVRDSYTENMFKKMGIMNVINTSCPTMWDLTPEHCKKIPTHKSDEVVFTITDYRKDHKADKKMIDTLLKNYEKVSFWVQGMNDYEYFMELDVEHSKVKILNPSLENFNQALHKKVDYVGTRLHAGIRALQLECRSIIVTVDNRAKEKEKDYNIKTIDRNDIESLEDMINSSFETEIKIPLDNIEKWKSQFK